VPESSIPWLSQWRMARYERQFRAHRTPTHHIYRGVYRTFEAARASVPATHAEGYDNTQAAELYRDRTRRVFLNDYPMMYWLQRWLGDGARSVFDLGGHIGIAYYAYQKYVAYPSHLAWTVSDVPSVNRAGEAWALDHDPARRLRFTDDATDMDGYDLLLAAGSLQYLDYTLAEALGRLHRKPRYLLLNSVPVHPSRSYFTVQNMGVTCCPYRVSSEREFLDGLQGLGYRMQDRWENTQRHCTVPFHPELSLDRYFGFAFRYQQRLSS
jgi:putative methyltransferase (TIGR04325 family)